jgi:hypothetical protein
MPTIQEALNNFKTKYEAAVVKGGEVAKTSDIRSQTLINFIHEAVKTEIVGYGINQNNIIPTLDQTDETTLLGFLKTKKQDIIVVPEILLPNIETVSKKQFKEYFLKLKVDETDKILSINVRSQLSSLAKNFDTLYERTFAEALNLHLRCPQICLGEVYLIPVYEYDTKAAQNSEVKFSSKIGNLEKYLFAFNAISERKDTRVDHFKYEKVCLLIVDFNKDIPKLYSSNEELKRDGLLSQDSTATISNLTFDQFIPSLLETYRARFPNLI